MVDESPNIRYTQEHEWVRLEDDGTVTVGISHYAQEALGDIVFVEMPEVGDEMEKEDALGVVESVKTTSDIYAPIAGTIVEINEALEGNPAVLNEAPYAEGWLVRLQPKSAEQMDALMKPAAYAKYLAEEAGH